MNRTPEEAIVLLKKTPKIRLTAQQEIAELEAEIRELKAWAGKNEGLMQAQDRAIEAVSKKVTELEAENAELLGALESSNAAAKRRGEESAELRKDKERLEEILKAITPMARSYWWDQDSTTKEQDDWIDQAEGICAALKAK